MKTSLHRNGFLVALKIEYTSDAHVIVRKKWQNICARGILFLQTIFEILPKNFLTDFFWYQSKVIDVLSFKDVSLRIFFCKVKRPVQVFASLWQLTRNLFRAINA